MSRQVRLVALVALLPVLVLLAGCGSGGSADLHPVKGKVVFKGGNISELTAANARVAFLLKSKERGGGGKIQPDGSFVAVSQTDTGTAEGLPAGEYDVFIQIPQGGGCCCCCCGCCCGGCCCCEPAKPVKTPINAKFTNATTSGITWTVPNDQELVIEVTK